MKPTFLHCLLVVIPIICLSACRESIDDKAVREARQYTAKNCPVEIAPGFVSDSLVFDKSSRTLNYHFSIKSDAGKVLLDSVQARANVLSSVVNATNLRIYKEAGFNFRYTYRSASPPHALLLDLVFTPEDYE